MAYTTIDDPSAYFQTKLYTGNSTNNTAITNDGNSDLQPDWIWVKSRTNTHYHDLRDSTRGVTKRLVSNTNDAESTKDQSYVSFDSDGFTLGDDTDSGGSALNTINTSSNNYVAWQWKANGGTTSSNSDGSITSTVQANTTAGFSIVTYTGNGSNGATVGHGLSNNLALILIKRRVDDGSGNNFNWQVWHKSFTDDHRGAINTTGAIGSPTDLVFDTSANTTSVFGLGFNNTSNQSSKTYVAYCFAEIQGYSKFGSYTGGGTVLGNNSADGTFVYTGFSPSWLLVKNNKDGEGWFIFDSKVDDATAGGNAVEQRFQINETQAEVRTENAFDFLSNGFKLRTDTGFLNGAGDSFTWWAYAKHPFVSSEGVPTTAR